MISQFKKIINSENKKRLVSNFFSLATLRGLQLLIPLMTLPYLVRTIGIEKFGLVSFSLSFALFFGAIIQFGFSVTATREISCNRDDLPKLEKIYSVTLSAAIFLASISSVVFIAIVLCFEKFNAYFSIYFFTLLFIVFQSMIPIWFFQGVENMKYIAFLSIVTSVCFLFSLFIFVKSPADVVLVPLLHCIAAAITFVFSLLIIRYKFNVGFRVQTWNAIKFGMFEGRHGFINQLAPNLYNNSTVFLLGLFTSNYVVGLYAAVAKVVFVFISFGSVFSNAFLPYLSRNPQGYYLFQKIMIALGGVLTVTAVLFSESIVHLLFGKNNLVISNYLDWLALSIFFAFAYFTYNINYLMLRGQERQAKNIALYVSIFSLFNTIILIYFYSIWGAILSLLVARFMMSALSYYFYVKHKNMK